MKQRRLLAAVFILAALLVVFAAAAGGDAGDPLISLDYLTGIFAPAAEGAVQVRLDDAGARAYEAAETQWRDSVAALEGSSNEETVRDWTETRLGQGDVLSTRTGSQVLLLAGGATVRYDAGAVVDATDGTVLPSGGTLSPRHRYLVAEDTTALFTVASRTAVLDYCGGYHFTYADSTPDYNAMASALKELNLFRGSTIGYGEGYELESAPTRIQALVMLIRLLGEEDAALTRVGVSPYDDVPAGSWFAPYVTYAVEKGYTNGVGGNRFAPNLTASAQMYVEFVLRALGYSSTAQTNVKTAPERALSAGVITSGEQTALETREFLRADVVYLSWYALDVPLAQGSEALHSKLEGMGVFTAAAYKSARAKVVSARL